MEVVDKAIVEFAVETKAGAQELQQYVDRAKELRQTLKEIEKDKSLGVASDAWKAAKVELQQVEAAAAKLKKEFDLSTATYGQMQKQITTLTKELKTLKPGTEEFIAKSAELTKVKAAFEEVRKGVDGTAKAIADMEKRITESEDAALTFGELGTKVDLLTKKLRTLNPESQEFIDTTKQLQATKKYYDDVAKSVDNVTKEVNDQIKATKNSELSYGDLKKKVSLLEEDLRKLTPGTKEFIEATKQLKQAEKDLKGVDDEVKKIGKSMDDNQGFLGKFFSSFTTGFKGLLAASGILFILDALIQIGKTIFEDTAKFEMYESVLTNAFNGSKTAAKESMLAIQQLAANTVFSVDELTNGYVKMVNRGINPTKKEMVAMADLAASQGKTFDQYVEALLDAQTGEMERLKEFGIRGKKAGDDLSFAFKGATAEVKKTKEGFDTISEIAGKKVVTSFKSQEEAVKAAMVQLGQMPGVAGANATAMQTMTGKLSNIKDSLLAVSVMIGDSLKPVFSFFLDLVSKGIGFFIEMTKYTGPLIDVMSTLSGWFSKLGDTVMQLVYEIFPGLQNQTASASATMKVYTVVMTALQNVMIILVAGITNVVLAIGAMIEAGKAVSKLFSGDFEGAAQAWDNFKGKVVKGANNTVSAFGDIKASWKKAFVDAPKAIEKDHELAAGQLAQKGQDAISDKEKKEAEKRAKAAKKARDKEAKEVEKDEADLQKRIADMKTQSITDELTRETQKIADKYTLEIEGVRKSKANEASKNETIKLLEAEKNAKIQELTDKHLKETADKQQKALFEYQKITIELETDEKARKLAKAKYEYDVEKARIDKEVTDEKTKAASLTAIDQKLAKDKKDIDEEYRQKTREANANLRQLEYDAEVAALNGKELVNRNSEKKLLDIKKERLDLDLKFAKQQIADEQAAAEDAARKSIQDQTVLQQTLAAIKKKYTEEAVNVDKQYAADLEAFEKEKAELKMKRAETVSGAIQAIGRGDYNAAIALAQSLFQKEGELQNAKLKKFSETADAIGSVATQAVSFLNQLAQQRADREIALAKKEQEEKIASITAVQTARLDQIAKEKAAELERLEQELLANKLSKQQLTDLNTAFTREKERLELEYQAKIKAARDQGNKEEADRLQAERDDKIFTVKQQIYQNKLGADTAKEIEQDLADKKKSINDKFDKQTIDAKTKFEADKKKIDDDARKKEADAKLKAWKADKNAQIASAIIAGALATIKALASGFFPVNLVFAALTAAATAIQVIAIKNQQPPTFAGGGKIRNAGTLRGGRHGSRPGEAGISMIDRRSGQEVGEAEGGEFMYLLSRDATKYHEPLLDQLVAQSQSKKFSPINTFRLGGKIGSDGYSSPIKTVPFWTKKFAVDGVKTEGDYADTGSGTGLNEASASANADLSEAKKQGEEQLSLLREIRDNSRKTVDGVGSVVAAASGTRDAVSRVENAIWNTNQSGRLDAIIGGISSLKG
jgi:hypothetical protein